MLAPVSAARIALLGRLSIEREDDAARPRGLPGRRAELVFAYLAVEHRRTVSRDELADALWPDVLPDTWAAGAARRRDRGAPLPRGRTAWTRPRCSRPRTAATSCGCRPASSSTSTRRGRRSRPRARSSPAASPRPPRRTRSAPAALARLPFLPHHEGEWVDGVRGELNAIHARALELQVRAARAGRRPARGSRRRGAAGPGRAVQRGRAPAAHPRPRRGRRPGRRDDGVRALPGGARRELGVEPSAETEAVFREALARAAGRAAPARRDAGGLAAYSVLVVEDHDFQRRTARAAAARARRRHDRRGGRRPRGARRDRALGRRPT